MGLLDWFRPSPRMIAARWIAESMRREPGEWVEKDNFNGKKYTRGSVEVLHLTGLSSAWVKVNGEQWGGKEARMIVRAVKDRNSLLVTLQLSEAHA